MDSIPSSYQRGTTEKDLTVESETRSLKSSGPQAIEAPLTCFGRLLKWVQPGISTKKERNQSLKNNRLLVQAQRSFVNYGGLEKRHPCLNSESDDSSSDSSDD